MAVKKPAKPATSKVTAKTKKATTKVKIPVKAKSSARGAITEKLRKGEIYASIAEATELSKKQVAGVFDELHSIIERSMHKKGLGEFTMAGLYKIKIVRKPATKARKGISPFTGEETVFKAKPARNVVKIRPLKKLKEMVI
jgi:nucleoid DNA-binding protein